MKKAILFGFIFLLLFSFLAYAEETDCLYYFYGAGCQQCPDADRELSRLQYAYPQLRIERFEVYYNPENLQQLEQYFNAYQVSSVKQGVPAVFLTKSYFVGKDSIVNLLEQQLLDNHDDACPTLQRAQAVGLVGKASPKNVLETLTFAVVTGQGIKNAFNWIMLSLFAILILATIHLKEKKKVFRKGLFFVLGVFVTTLLFGFGFFTNLISVNVTTYFTKIVGAAAILYSVGWILNFFNIFNALKKMARQEIKNGVEGSKTIFLFSELFMLFWGLVFPLFTLSLASSGFLVLRTLFVGNIGKIAVVPRLLYVSIITVLPLLLFVFIIHVLRHHLDEQGAKVGYRNDRETQSWKKHYLTLLNFALNVALFICGLVLAFK